MYHIFSGCPLYPLDMDCAKCSRKEIRQFAQDAKDINIQYIGLCCGSSSNFLREVAVVYGRNPPTSAYSPALEIEYVLNSELTGHALKTANEMMGSKLTKADFEKHNR